jgi:serine/threonine protein kinase
MELLGKSLDILFQEQKKKFSIKTVSMIGIQMLERIEFIHNKYIIHRDIKPDNFLMGLDTKSHIIYLLDFGLSKKYRSTKTKQHIKFTSNNKLTGTARYASINALNGNEQSRRDDLEAIGYVLIFFLKGNLPWQGLKVNKGEDRYKKIYIKKKNTSPEILCEGLPSEFKDYIIYTRNLGFEDEPDYSYLKGLFVRVLEKENYYYDFWFDWMKEKPDVSNNLCNKYMNVCDDHNINYDYENKDNNNYINGNFLQTGNSDFEVRDQEINVRNLKKNKVDDNYEEDNKNNNEKENKEKEENNNNNIKNEEACFIF